MARALVLALGLTLALNGCGGPRLSGNETYVTVTPADDEADALPDAEKRCGTYGRIAHFKRMEGKSAVFDCDPRRDGMSSTGGLTPPGGG